MKFETRKLGELVINFDRKRVPLSSRQRSERQGVYPYYGATSIMDYVDDYIFDGKYLLMGEDGTVIDENGKPILQIAEGKFWCNNHAHILQNTELVTFDYLYYLLKNTNVQSLVTGAVQPKISQSNMNKLVLRIHKNKKEQEKIARYLRLLDDKIELNSAINNNLEQQAQAIFLKMFPNIFSASASSSFQNLIEFSNGRKRPETIGDIPVYGGNGVLAYTNQSNAENCVIIGRVGAYCGNTFLCPEKCWTSDNAIQAKSKNEASPLFIYYLLRNASLPSRHIGTGQPLMTQAILNAIPVNEPSTQEIKSFINICTPLHETIFANEKKNISLAILRDTLLPKLMSGELDVSNIEL